MEPESKNDLKDRTIFASILAFFVVALGFGTDASVESKDSKDESETT